MSIVNVASYSHKLRTALGSNVYLLYSMLYLSLRRRLSSSLKGLVEGGAGPSSLLPLFPVTPERLAASSFNSSAPGSFFLSP